MFKQGQILVFDHGSYDPRRTIPFRVLKDLEKDEAVSVFVAAHPDDEEREFVLWLVSQGYIEPVAIEHWFLGENYSFAPLDFVDDNEDEETSFWYKAFVRTPEAQKRHEVKEAAYAEKHRKQWQENIDSGKEWLNRTTSLDNIAVGSLGEPINLWEQCEVGKGTL